jgi:hypothetical protein
MFRLRTLLIAGALASTALLGGCVYYPGYGGYYGGYYGGPYYGGAVVAYGDGWHHHGWWHRDGYWYR